MNYCVQCEYCKVTNEANLCTCNLVPHMVCGETVECKDFKVKSYEEAKKFKNGNKI